MLYIDCIQTRAQCAESTDIGDKVRRACIIWALELVFMLILFMQ